MQLCLPLLGGQLWSQDIGKLDPILDCFSCIEGDTKISGYQHLPCQLLPSSFDIAFASALLTCTGLSGGRKEEVDPPDAITVLQAALAGLVLLKAQSCRHENSV